MINKSGVNDIKIIKISVTEAMLQSESYDYIYTINTLHHVFERGNSHDIDVLDTMRRLFEWLKPGGSLLVFDVGNLVFWRLFPPLLKYVAPGVCYKTKSGYRRWLRCAKKAGFKLQKIRWVVPYKLRSIKINHLLENNFMNIFLDGAYVMRLTKD